MRKNVNKHGESRLSPARKKLVLKVARKIYPYDVPEDFDFSRSTHGQERGAWNTALSVIELFQSWAIFAPRLGDVTAEEFRVVQNGQLPEEYAL